MARQMFATRSAQNSGRNTPSTISTTTEMMEAPPRSYTSTPNLPSENNNNAQWKSARPRREEADHKVRSDSRPTRLRTSPSQSGKAVAMAASSHGKLHKRGSSASSLASTPTSAFPAYDASYDGIVSPPVTAYQDPRSSHSPVSSRSKVAIKPLLRKISPQENKSLDLSRSVAENEGLGIYTSSTGREHRGGSDAGYSQKANSQRAYHARTTSGGSQISTTTTSSTQRPGQQYIHPMRQTPQSYTPPIAHHSYNISYESDDPRSTHTSEESSQPFYNQHPSSANRTLPSSYNSYSNLTATSYAPVPPALHVRTTSTPRMNSPSPLPGTPSSLRYAEPYSTTEPIVMPGTSRSSFDSTFRLKRSRTNTATTLDPAQQLAAVSALRAEFKAKEDAKDLKIQMAEAKARDKVTQRRERRDESLRRKSETQERKRARSTNASEKSMPISAVEYTSTAAFPVSSDLDLDLERLERERAKTRKMRVGTNDSRKGIQPGKAGKAVASSWSLFWFQFKTVWLKFKRSLGGGR